MDNLYRDLIIFIFSNSRTVYMENPKALVKWLLSLGQDPRALGLAIMSRQTDLIELLLDAGAIINRDPWGSNPWSIMSLILPGRICDKEGARIIRLLLSHDKALTAEETLHAAILLKDGGLFKEALDNGADISLSFKTLKDISTPRMSNVVEKETSLSMAAGVSLHVTAVVLGLLQTRNQVIKAASLITPDVFISAACAGNADVISFLHSISPVGSRRNARGITPLEVAITHGHREAYQLLYQLYRQSSATLLLIPIFTDQLDILHYLLANGLDVNVPTEQADIRACWSLGLNRPGHWNFRVNDTHKSPTVLELFLREISLTDNCDDGIKLLNRTGGFFPPEAIIGLSSAGHDDLLSAALEAGGDPNAQYPNGDNALASALRSKSTNCIQLLLERGAELQTLTPKVFEALLPEHVCNIQGERANSVPMK